MPSPNNLPGQLTSFIGRELEAAEIKRLLARNRLVTLTGAGGTGKTRLSLKVAADLLDSYADGVWFVDLARLGDASMVPQAVASALGIREEPDSPLIATLSTYIRPLKTLILLDNCEHLVEACSTLADILLRTCPDVRILATSRQALNVEGEVAWRVPPLSCPSLDDNTHGKLTMNGILQTTVQYDAVQLFVDRAKLRRPDFVLKSNDANAVVRLCSQLDGMPLAIELAAARTNVLTVDDIVNRLDGCLRLLSSPSQTVPTRQQTLTALMDWSYDLLPEKEQVLLRGLSVFAGGFTLGAIQAVCASQIDKYEIIDLLSQLLDKSLVIMDSHDGNQDGGEARYHLLETVRQYAREKLTASGEIPDVGDRHKDWCLRLAEQSEQQVQGPQQTLWLDRLEAEHHNMRVALRWSLDHEDGETLLRISGALSSFWYVHGYLSEGHQWLMLGLENSAGLPASLRAKALYGANRLANQRGDYAQAKTLVEEALALFRELGDKQGVANSLNNLGTIAGEQGDFTAARALFEESVSIRRELSDKSGIAGSLNNLGKLAREQGDYTAAHSLFQESLSLYRELGDKRGIAASLGNLGGIAWERADYAGARSLYEESLAIDRELGNKRGMAGSLGNLGGVAHSEREYVRARSLYEESLSIRRELGDKSGIAICMVGLGGVAAGMGQPHLGAKLLGVAETLLEAIGAVLSADDRIPYRQGIASIRAQLGEDQFERARAEGRTIDMERAFEIVLQLPDGPEPGHPPAKAPTPAGATPAGAVQIKIGLTGREIEVLGLLASGLTNPEIAHQLSLSVHTVEAHLRSIYSKLGVTTRNAAAHYAHENNLLA